MKHTLFRCRHFSDTTTSESSVTLIQPVILSPWSRGQFREIVYIVWSVSESSSETSRACRWWLLSTRSETPLSVSWEQLVNVRRSIRLQCVKGTTVPSLTFSVNAERFSLLMRSEYEKSLSGFPTAVATLFRSSQLLHDGRCHSIATQFAAQPLHTNMQFNRSDGELSFEKMEISNSGGRRAIGASVRTLSTSRSRRLEPTDDWESFDIPMTISVSSSQTRSGDDDEDDSDGASLENRAACRDREMGMRKREPAAMET